MITDFEQIHNFYERLVLEQVMRRADAHPQHTTDMLADVACVALNRLPARYVRHDVDLMFYLTEEERHSIEMALEEAVIHAFALVAQRGGSSRH